MSFLQPNPVLRGSWRKATYTPNVRLGQWYVNQLWLFTRLDLLAKV